MAKRKMTVRQSVEPAHGRQSINVQLATPGVAEDIITIGGGLDEFECIRAFSLTVDKDCYMELGGAATSASIPLEAGAQFNDDNCDISPNSAVEQQTRISVINKNPGERPTVTGVVAGY